MSRTYTFFFLLAIVLFSACKKDMLHVRNLQRINSNTDTDRLNKILFINDSIGFIAGGQRFAQSVILSTKDGGYTWQKTSFPAAPKGLYDLVQSPAGSVYACGFDGKLLHTNDTGKNWIFNQIEYFAFTGIAFTDAAHAIVVGGVSFGSGIREYIDTSAHVLQRDSLPYQFNKITMADAGNGYLCGYGVMQKTTDGGKTWTFQEVNRDNFTAMDIHGDEVWMCGANGGIFHTYNGGARWTRLRNGNDISLPRYRLYTIVFKDNMHGWAAGEEGKLIYTDDGGKHWAEYAHFTNSTIRDIALCPNSDLLVVGDNGIIFRIATN